MLYILYSIIYSKAGISRRSPLCLTTKKSCLMGFLNDFGKAVASSGGTGFVGSFMSGVANGIVNSIFNSDQRQLRNNRKLLQQQYDFNKMAYDYQFAKEAEYNDPSAQRARLESAGLSPALMYGNGASGGSISAQFGNAAGNGRVSPTNFGGFSDPEAVSRIEVNNALADKYRSEAEGNRGQTLPSQDLQALRASETNLNVARERLAKMEYHSENERRIGYTLDNSMKQIDRNIKQATQQVTVDQIEANLDMTRMQFNILVQDLEQADFRNSMNDVTRATAIASYNNLLRQGVLLGVQAELANAGINKTTAEISAIVANIPNIKQQFNNLVAEYELTKEKAITEEKLRSARKWFYISGTAKNFTGSVKDLSSEVRGYLGRGGSDLGSTSGIGEFYTTFSD